MTAQATLDDLKKAQERQHNLDDMKANRWTEKLKDLLLNSTNKRSPNKLNLGQKTHKQQETQAMTS